MNWFQRYGIPGAYFFMLTMAWVIALSDLTIKKIDSDTGIIVSLAVITFLPVGYILSIFQQWIYYTRKSLGIHREAAIRASFPPFFPDVEPNIEVYSLKLIWDYNQGTLDKHKFFNEWVRRRMDVIAINFSLLIATLLSPLIASFITYVYFKWNPQLLQMLFILIISFAIHLAVCLSRTILREQIIKALVDIYKVKKESVVKGK